MADDWDPFAVPDSEDVLAAPVEAVHTGPSARRIPQGDVEKVWDHVWRRLQHEHPWTEAVEPYPDTSCFTNTCDIFDWQHHDVKVEIGDGIAYIILNRPNENNSMQDSLNAGMSDAVLASSSIRTVFVWPC